MIFTFVSVLTVCAVGFVFVWAIYADKQSDTDNASSDMRVYREQLDEVDRDLERGLLTTDQAGAVRTEVSRRLLTASAAPRPDLDQTTEPRAWLLAGILGCLAIGVASLYGGLGSFGASDLPIASRIATLEEARSSRPSQQDAETIALAQKPTPEPSSQEHLAMVSQLRNVVADRPNDVQGLRLLARQEAMIGNYAAARAALEKVIVAQGDAPEISDLASLFDTMLFNANDYISPEAEQVLLQLRDRAPDLLLGQFYEGMLEIQSGRPDRAFPIWRDLVNLSPADAPWIEFVRGEMPIVAAATGVEYALPPLEQTAPGPTADDIATANELSAVDRQQMIEGMVSQLSNRLADEGGTVEEWRRLIRALAVLDRQAEANEVLHEAKLTFQSDLTASTELQKLGTELGLE